MSRQEYRGSEQSSGVRKRKGFRRNQTGWINRAGDPREVGWGRHDSEVSGGANRRMSLPGVGAGSAEHSDDAGELMDPGGAHQRGLL